MMSDRKKAFEYYNGKKVLVTGASGFKGSWLVKMLLMAGAEVTGYALAPDTKPSLFDLLGLNGDIEHFSFIEGDVRDYGKLFKVFTETQPEIVFHLAAQPLVRRSYSDPRYTYETNVMGTVNVCECVRLCDSVRSFLNVTTDKVYLNRETMRGYVENDPLDGFDPYSNSKSCSELVTHSYINSFFKGLGKAVSTARAGNVIGGGDFSEDRIIPDGVRAACAGEALIIRNPESIRPYQHVLEPLSAYLMIAAAQDQDISKAGYYNVGPDDSGCITTGELVSLFEKHFGEGFSSEIRRDKNAPHEATLLKLDTSLIRKTFGWNPVWNIDDAVKKTVEWTKAWMADDSVAAVNEITESQINSYLN